MGTVQRVLLLAFAVLAALTVLQQMRYGMLCGRAEGQDRQADPKAQACRRRAVFCAVAAAVCLGVNIALGALNK